MTQDNNTFLGFEKKQIPILALLATVGGVLIAFGGIIIALQMGTRSDMNANYNAHRADIRALDSRVDTLSVEAAETNARLDNIERRLENTERQVDALTVEAVETNARLENVERRVENTERRVENVETKVENIERNLPDYASIDNRITELEREQARIAELEREQARLSELVADLVNAE